MDDAPMQLEQLQAITGLDEGAAQNLLDAAGGNIEAAVQLHFNWQDEQARPPPAAAAADSGFGAYADPDYDDDSPDDRRRTHRRTHGVDPERRPRRCVQ